MSAIEELRQTIALRRAGDREAALAIVTTDRGKQEMEGLVAAMANRQEEWWCPKPWMVTDCRLDPQAGGEFYTLMRGPDGEESPVHGCFLEVCDQEKLVWTELMTAGFRPVPTPPFGFVAVVTMEDWGSRTRYTVRAMHTSADSRRQHEEMGFYDGWGTTMDQMADIIERLKT